MSPLMARWVGAVATALLALLLPTTCGSTHDAGSTPGAAASRPVRVLLVGDVMLGRGVAPIVSADPHGVFSDVRQLLRDADLALGNLESPLTTLPHRSENPNIVIADPSGAALLASAGFDGMNLANNHAGDGGVGSVVETIVSIEAVGMRVIGAGEDAATAIAPTIFEVSGLRIAVLGFDLTGAGLAAGENAPGVAPWDDAKAEDAVRRARAATDLVIVSLHGGVEYLSEPDPRVRTTTERVAEWGADVVWGHGAHVPYPVHTVTRHDRTTIVADSLGNFLFDQRGVRTGAGVVLEVLAGERGVVAFRRGTTSHRDLRAHFTGWDLPDGDAALISGEWWSMVGSGESPATAAMISDFPWGDVISASVGSVIRPGRPELVVSFRKPEESHVVRDGFPAVRWSDDLGRTTHLGIYDAADLTALWVASVVPAPIAEVVACDRSIAMSYSALDSDAIVATGAARWIPHGLVAAELLPGDGVPSCRDVDRDGQREPTILRGPGP